MRRLAVTLTALAFLGLALASGAKVFWNAPAYNKALRAKSVIGDWRVPVSRALYDNGEYLFQLGYGFLQGDSTALLLGEDGLPDRDTFSSRVGFSVTYLEESLRSSPGRVDAWTSLAWARLLAGDRDGSEAALRISWSLAPRNFGEAPKRLALVETIDEIKAVIWRQDDRARVAVTTDLKALKRFDPRQFAVILRDVPELRASAERADILDTTP